MRLLLIMANGQEFTILSRLSSSQLVAVDFHAMIKTGKEPKKRG